MLNLPSDVADVLFQGIRDLDVDAALSVVAQDATVDIAPAGVGGLAQVEGRAFLTETMRAFPDLTLAVKRWFVAGPCMVVAEVTFEGTQATDYLGIVNQEKHIDVDQVWVITVADGRVTHIRAIWDQNQIYRRLAVKRLDSIAIVGAGRSAS